MNQKKAKTLRKMADDMCFGREDVQEETCYVQKPPKKHLAGPVIVWLTPGTIKLGQCNRRVYQWLKQQLK